MRFLPVMPHSISKRSPSTEASVPHPIGILDFSFKKRYNRVLVGTLYNNIKPRNPEEKEIERDADNTNMVPAETIRG